MIQQCCKFRNYVVPPSLQVLWNRGPYKYLPQGAALAGPSCLFHPKQVIKIRVVDPPPVRSYTLQEVPWHRVHLSLVWENCEMLGRSPNPVVFFPFWKKEILSPLKRSKNVPFLAGAGCLWVFFLKRPALFAILKHLINFKWKQQL